MEAREGILTLYQKNESPRILDISEKRKIPTGINVPPTGVYLEELEHFISCLQKDVDSDIIKNEQVLHVLGYLEQVSREL